MSWEKDFDYIWNRTRYCREGKWYVRKAYLEEISPCYYSVGVELKGEKFSDFSEAKKYYNDIKVIERADDGDVVGKILEYWPTGSNTLKVLAKKIYGGKKREDVENLL